MRTSEGRLVGGLVRFLLASDYRVRLEVPNMGQSVDIVATRGRWATFIEVKATDWKRALRQCRSHECVADYVCVAIGTRSVSTALLDAARGRGYGVLHCLAEEEQCMWVVKPRLNKKKWPPQRKQLGKDLKAISHER